MAPRVSCMLQTYTKFNWSDAKVKINTLLSRNTHRFNYSNNYLFDASYAIYENCGGILSNQVAANLLENLPVKKNWESVKIWQKHDHEFSVQFLAILKMADKNDTRDSIVVGARIPWLLRIPATGNH